MNQEIPGSCSDFYNTFMPGLDRKNCQFEVKFTLLFFYHLTRFMR